MFILYFYVIVKTFVHIFPAISIPHFSFHLYNAANTITCYFGLAILINWYFIVDAIGDTEMANI